MKKTLAKLLTSKRFWVIVAGTAAPGIGLIPAAVALKVTAVAVVATKVIDIANE